MCLEKGDRSSACSALDWLKEEQQFPEVSSTNMVFVASLRVHVEVKQLFFLFYLTFFSIGLKRQADHRDEKGRRLSPVSDELQLPSPVGDSAELH